MKTLLPTLATALTLIGGAANSFAQTASTVPVGAMTVTIPAGTGSVKKTSLLSFPLLQTAQITGLSAGRLSSVTQTTFSDTSAGWISGELSNAAEPKILLITSGSAEGHMFLLSSQSSNTPTTVTIAASDSAVVNLTTLGIATGSNGDSYRILDCDTLLSLFGTPETTGIAGGTSAATADSVILVVNGTPNTYFYKSDSIPPRWTRSAFGNPDASNTVILPHYGIQYSRLANSPITLTLLGDVPSDPRRMFVKNAGTTFLSQFWPLDGTLSSSGISSLPSWTSGASATVADTVIVTSNGTPSTFWFDGTNWRKSAFGNPISNSTVIPAGSSLSLVKKGSATGYSLLNQALPYSIE